MSRASFDGAESIVTEVRHNIHKEAARELSRDYRTMKPEDFKHVFDGMNSQLKIANLPEVKAHYGKNGKIESFDFGGDLFKTEKSPKRQEHVGTKSELRTEVLKPEAKKEQPKPEEKKERQKPES